MHYSTSILLVAAALALTVQGKKTGIEIVPRDSGAPLNIAPLQARSRIERRDNENIQTNGLVWYGNDYHSTCDYDVPSSDYALYVPAKYEVNEPSSSLCGAFVKIEANDGSGLSVNGYVAGASSDGNHAGLNQASYDAISPQNSVSSVNWYFYTTDPDEPVSLATAINYFGTGGSDEPKTHEGTLTYYVQNGKPNACLEVNYDDQFIAAMDTRMYGDYSPSPYCGRRVHIDADNGNSVEVTIADECPTCDSIGSLDLSVAAFEQIAELYVGVVNATWYFID